MLPPLPIVIDAPRQAKCEAAKRARNLMVSSSLRVSNYVIGRDRGEE
jgi:hypothetical protein